MGAPQYLIVQFGLRTQHPPHTPPFLYGDMGLTNLTGTPLKLLLLWTTGSKALDHQGTDITDAFLLFGYDQGV